MIVRSTCLAEQHSKLSSLCLLEMNLSSSVQNFRSDEMRSVMRALVNLRRCTRLPSAHRLSTFNRESTLSCVSDTVPSTCLPDD